MLWLGWNFHISYFSLCCFCTLVRFRHKTTCSVKNRSYFWPKILVFVTTNSCSSLQNRYVFLNTNLIINIQWCWNTSWNCGHFLKRCKYGRFPMTRTEYQISVFCRNVNCEHFPLATDHRGERGDTFKIRNQPKS